MGESRPGAKVYIAIGEHVIAVQARTRDAGTHVEDGVEPVITLVVGSAITCAEPTKHGCDPAMPFVVTGER